MPGATITTDTSTRPRRASVPTDGRAPGPVRLRVWATCLAVGIAVLLGITSLAVSRMSGDVHAIGDQAAPQAATASDLYFALSDLDAEVAQLVMLGNTDSLAGNRSEAMYVYQQRSREIDTDLAQAVRGAQTEADRTRCQQLADGLALYRQWAWQALAVQAEATDQTPGRPPSATLGYYTQAGNVMRTELLPTAVALRRSSENSLDGSYSAQRSTEHLATALILAWGVLLIAALVLFQVRLARRYHRLLNPALLLATVCTLAMVAAVSTVLLDEAGKLERAQRDAFGPYLALTQAQAISYDAAGDTSRYLIATNPSYVQGGIKRKSQCLVSGGTCGSGGDILPGGLATLAAGPGTSQAQAREVLTRWQAYQHDSEQISTLVDSGQLDRAVATLTGIARGDAAFDFYYFNDAVTRITAQRRSAFDAALADARSELALWPLVPPATLVVAILLILLGVRPRLAEYR